MGQTTSAPSTNGLVVTTGRAGLILPPKTTRAGLTVPAATNTVTSGLRGYTAVGCYQDLVYGQRTLNAYAFFDNGMTIDKCQSTCRGMGYSLSGVENGNECYCANTITGCAGKVATSSCSTPCRGNTNQKCGAGGLLNLYAVDGYGVKSTGCVVPTTSKTTPTPTSTLKTSTTSTKSAATGGVGGGGGAKKVFAHFMIGNTYSMQSINQYQTEISKAISMGIDGFACNIGSDSWQPNRLGLMYQAAQSFPNFVIFVSLDMAVLAGHPFSYLYQFVTPYTSHPNQYKINGRHFVSTFAGESYTGGQSDPPTAWLFFKNQLAAMGTNIYFVPSFTGYGAACLGWEALDGAFSWNAWTKSTDEDNYYLLSRNNPSTYTNTNIKTGYYNGDVARYTGKTYMAGIGPLFFTHFDYKNWIYSNDNLYNKRWENIVATQPDFVEIISWNDYGESHYIGDIVGSLPYDGSGYQSSTWANNDGFDHTPLAQLTKYYISAYKAGAYPGVSQNTLFMWYRPHSIHAQATADPYGKPACQSADCPADDIYITVLLTGPATVKVTSAGSTQTFEGRAGRNVFQYLGFGQGSPSVTVQMGGSTVLSRTATLAINNSIRQYNYNLHYDAWTF